ncbi:MAG: hypothetical protein RMJ13_00960 [Elusimicrobiota bacterium]|nr:hypothetical protein [Elusimicrobiota bacterium]
MYKRLYCNIAFPIPVHEEYTYFIPEEITKKQENFVGYRVIADFGRQKDKVGVIIEVFDDKANNNDIKIKPVKSFVEEFPFFTYEQISTAKEQAYQHFVSTGLFLNEFFPIEHKVSFWQSVIVDKQKKFITELNKKFVDIITGRTRTVLFIPNTINEKFSFYVNVLFYALISNQQTLMLFPNNYYINDFIEFIKHSYDEQKLIFLFSNLFLYTGEVDIKQRYKIWYMFRTGQIKIVLGTKIAAFLPLDNVNIVIIDEPDSLGYKNPEVPMYNSISVLEARSKNYQFKLIYCSFTPSVGRMYKCKSKIVLGDDKLQKGKTKIEFVKRQLKEVVTRNLYKFKQTIIIYPYKESARYCFCLICKKLVIYKKTKSGFVCPECGSDRSEEYNIGGEKLKQLLLSSFKNVTIEYFDAETKENRIRNIIENFNKEKIDILLTTTAIINYIYRINFSNVASVYFAYLDSLLYRPSFLSYEYVYKLIKLFEILLTSNTDSSVIYLEIIRSEKYNKVLLSKYNTFVRKELDLRKELKYPPFTHIVKIGIISNSFEQTDKFVENIEKNLKDINNIFVFPSFEKNQDIKKGKEVVITVKILSDFNTNIKKVVDVLKSISELKLQKVYVDHNPSI